MKFRLAGQQPRRGQILDFIAWFERQLDQTGVEVLFNSPFFSEDVIAFEADAVVLATGSIPSQTGYQRGIPTRDALPGIDCENVWDVEDVMNRSAKLGKSVLLLDDVGTWKAGGTALHMVEKGHELSIVTPYPVVGREITRTGADLALRERLRKAGTRFYCESVVTEWSGNQAGIKDLLDGSTIQKEFDSLVLATVNLPVNELECELAGEQSFEIHAIGDCLSPRQTPAATYEGRKVGMQL